MATRKTYGQFCGLARSLDRVGDRWTLLVVRELLIGEASFKELQAALPGVAPNLLADRLRSLAAEGIVERNEAPRRSKAVRYRMTDFGRSIEPAVLELIRWGARWMKAGPDGDRVDPRWGVLALRALLSDASTRRPRGSVHLSVDGIDLTVDLTGNGRRVGPGRPERPRARVHASLPSVLGVASGSTPLDDAPLDVSGDEEFARIALTPAG